MLLPVESLVLKNATFTVSFTIYCCKFSEAFLKVFFQFIQNKKTSSVGGVNDLNENIIAQGVLVRNLKAQKANKSDIDVAVKVLLALKEDYKVSTSQEWKPNATNAVNEKAIKLVSKECTNLTSDLNEKIILQGDQVRNLKSQKANKLDIDSAVKILLGLKNEFKAASGQDWKPNTSTLAAVKTEVVRDSASIQEKIVLQGEQVRNLKAQKADKGDIDVAVKLLLSLKNDFKIVTGQEWKPNANPSSEALKLSNVMNPNASDLNEKISLQGEQVRNLKAFKANKLDIDAAVKILLSLKVEYKTVTGQDWKQSPTSIIQNKINMDPVTKPATVGVDRLNELTDKINEQGNVVRNLKSQKAAKPEVDSAVKLLLNLKDEFKALSGNDFPIASSRNPAMTAKKTEIASKEKKKPELKKPTNKEVKEDGAKKQTRLGLEAKKEENLPDWYSQVITKGEMIEYYDVSGCYILRHWSFAIWKMMRNWFDAEITKMGVKECYFPMFVSKAALEKEKSHIADFAPEVAWVTKSGESELAEPIAVRPTSETVNNKLYILLLYQ